MVQLFFEKQYVKIKYCEYYLYGGRHCLYCSMKRENKSNFFDIIIYGMMIVAVIYIVIQTILENNSELSFKITLGIWILTAVIINDYVEPLVNKVFDDISAKKGGMYLLYAVCDAASYACFYIFIINIGLTKEVLHYVFLGIAVVLFIGRLVFYNIFQGMEDETLETEKRIDDGINDTDDVMVNTLDENDDIRVMIYRERNK